VTQIQIENGHVVNALNMVEPIELPEPLTLEVVRAMFDTPADSPCYLPNLILTISSEDRARFEQFCRDNDMGQEWASAAVRWVGLLNPDNQWHLDEFNIVHRARVGSWWVDEVVVADTGHQFAITDDRIFTPAEFEMVYGTSLSDHLLEFASFQRSQLVQLTETLAAGLIVRRACVQDHEGQVGTMPITGPSTVPAEEWILPEGCSLVDQGEVVDTIAPLYQECASA
jgi:hypothetical protein